MKTGPLGHDCHKLSSFFLQLMVGSCESLTAGPIEDLRFCAGLEVPDIIVEASEETTEISQAGSGLRGKSIFLHFVLPGG